MERSYEILSQTSPIERRAALVDDLAAESPLMADILVAMAMLPPILAGAEADAWIQDTVLNTQLERRNEAIREYALHNSAQLMFDSMGDDAPVIMGLLNRRYGGGDPDAAAEGKVANEAEANAITSHIDELLAIIQDIKTRGLPAIVMSDKLREFISAVMPVDPNLILARGVLDAIRSEVVEPAEEPAVAAGQPDSLPISHDQRGLMRPNRSGPKHLRQRDRSFGISASCKALKKTCRQTVWFDRRSQLDDPSPKRKPFDWETEVPEMLEAAA